MLKVPEYYQQIDSLPSDPEGSTAYGGQTDNADILILVYPEDGDVMFYDEAKAIEQVRGSLADDQGIIEVKAGQTKQGLDYVYSITKMKYDPSVSYYVLFMLKDGNQQMAISGMFNESGMTGQRDTLVFDKCLQEKVVDLEGQGWFRDPYDENFDKGFLMNLSEIRDFDKYFPSHPLTLARELCDYVVENN